MSARDLVFFSPLPPTRNGIADYSAGFLGKLADQFNVYAVVADNATVMPPAGIEVLRMSEYMPFSRTFDTAGHVYQIGNNIDHHYMLPAIAQKPGLSTVHDLSLQHMIGRAFPAGVRDAAYAELMTECYGLSGREISDEVLHFDRQSHVVHTECGFLPAIVRRSAGLVTHSKLGLLRLGACGYDRPIHLIDHPCRDECVPQRLHRSDARLRARQDLNLPANATIILSLGFVTQAKQLNLIFGAIAALRGQYPNIRLVIAGAVGKDSSVIADIARLGLGEFVIMRDYVPHRNLTDYLAAADILVNLRYPTLGETSGSLSNGLGVGCCAIVTDVGTYAELPDDCVVKIPVADMTVPGVTRHLLPVLCNTKLRAQYEAAAASYAERHLATDTFIERYVQAIEQVLFPLSGLPILASSPPTRAYLAPTERLAVERTAWTIAQDRPPTALAWWRELMLPLGESAMRLLVIGDRFAADLARAEFNWHETIDMADFDTVPDPASGDDYDVILIIVDAARFLKEGGDIVANASRRLAQSGTLILNIVGDGLAELDRLFSREGLPIPSRSPTAGRGTSVAARALEASGYRIEVDTRIFSEVSSIFPLESRHESIVRGRKLFECSTRQPVLPLLHY